MSLVNQEDLFKYIPQRLPIVMVSELIEHEEEKSVSKLNIKPDNMFCADGHFTEPGLIENIAQSAALRSGYATSLKGDQGEAPVGFIGAIAKLKIHNLPSDTDTIETSIEHLNEVFGVTLVRGSVKRGEELMAECEMKIVIAENNG